MLYQYGTMAGLVGRALSGKQTVEELVQHGDFGIGTFHGVDGEMVVLDGKVYKIDYTGKAQLSKKDETTPFATVTNFKPVYSKKSTANFDNFLSDVSEHLNPNYFYAIKMTGTFKSVSTRIVKKQEEPYPTLLGLTKTQSIYNYENTTGVIVGFFSPSYSLGLSDGSLHIHYLSDDKTQGGHIFNFEIADALVEISEPLDFMLELPKTKEYAAMELDSKTMHAEIHKAEAGE